jgi:hypothetical protein
VQPSILTYRYLLLIRYLFINIIVFKASGKMWIILRLERKNKQRGIFYPPLA